MVLAWVAIAATGGALARRAVDALTYEFALPGQPAYEANQRITSPGGAAEVSVIPLPTARRPVATGT